MTNFDEDDAEFKAGEEIPVGAYKRVGDFLNSIDESTMQAMFGNHVQVTIRRGKKKPVIDEYSHD